jgi:tetratricopeptide (TPR) repeat protein
MDPRAIEPDELLGPENEAQWDRLRSQLELAEEFWLGFVFSPAPRSAAVLRERVARLLFRQRKMLLSIQPATPVELRGVLLMLVDEHEPAHAGCVWVEAVRSDSPGAREQPWTEAWDDLFLRANVRRDVLRKRLPGGLVFAATPEIKPRVREAAPDLWSVRSLVIDLQAVRPVAKMDMPALPRLERIEGPAPDPEFALAEAARRGAHGATQSQAQALVQAAEGLLAAGKAREARDAALKAWELLEEEGGMAEARALAMLARADNKDQDYAAAADHIARAIAISRRAERDGVPNKWYLLAGQVAFSLRDFAAARAFFEEGEASARSRLTQRENNLDLIELIGSLNMLSVTRGVTGHLDAALALAEEAATFARKLVVQDPARGHLMLRVTLRALANTHRARGDEAAAIAAEEEAASLPPP